MTTPAQVISLSGVEAAIGWAIYEALPEIAVVFGLVLTIHVLFRLYRRFI